MDLTSFIRLYILVGLKFSDTSSKDPPDLRVHDPTVYSKHTLSAATWTLIRFLHMSLPYKLVAEARLIVQQTEQGNKGLRK